MSAVGRPDISQGRYFIKSLGCQMNEYDAGRMEAIMRGHGLVYDNDQSSADLIIINTCHIREKATEKLYSMIGRIKEVKKSGSKLIIAGCVAQAEGEEVIARAPCVDAIIGPQSIHKLRDLLPRLLNNQPFERVNLEFDDQKFFELPAVDTASKVSAFLSVQEGCNRFCRFCCVPYTRGPEYSRPLNAILAEAKLLIENGAKEITLLGQNVSAYHGLNDGVALSLRDLLQEVAGLSGLERLRYTTSHPQDFMRYESLIAAHANIQKLMPFLHLPVQSGSSRVLKDMNRKHTREEYLEVIEKLCNARPGIHFSTDIIVGYPGETDEDFEDTMSLSRRVGFSQGYLFKFSPRPGTPAASRKDFVPKHVVDSRFDQLKEVFDSMQSSSYAQLSGEVLDVLIEGKNQLGQLFGRTPHLQLMNIDSGDEALVGCIKKSIVTKTYGHSLRGNLFDIHEPLGAT